MQFYVHHDGQQRGPLDLALVRSHLGDGTFLPTDLGWHEGLAEWMPLSAIPALAAAPSGQALPPALPTAPGTGGSPAGGQPIFAGQAPRTSGLATASMVLGLCSFLCGFLTGLPAVICGHLSLSEIKKSGGALKGRGQAITGLIIGYLMLLIVPIAILAGIALPVFNAVQMKGQQLKALTEAKEVALACKQYAGEHDGNYPDSLEELVPKYLADNALLVCHLTKDGPNEGYDYAGGKDSDPPRDVLLSSRAISRDHKRIVVHKDGSGELVRE